MSKQDAINAFAAQGLTYDSSSITDVANAVLAAYTAYTSNKPPVLPGFTIVSKIMVEERAIARHLAPNAPRRAAAAAADPQYSGNTLMGFSAFKNDRSVNIIALRGTVTDEEAGYDLYGWGTNVPCKLPSQGGTQQSYGNVKQDLYDFYTDGSLGADSLAKSCMAAVNAVQKANPGKPLVFAAHSLGGPLANLAALDATVSKIAAPSPIVVTFGSLHLGDAGFGGAYMSRVPATLRYANLCDFVPAMVSLTPPTSPSKYVHVGLECTFVWQTWDDWGNHSMQNIYLATVRDYLDVVQVGPRTYPQ